jgi:hypothetical protein
LKEQFNNAISESSDVREFLPEGFYMPEMYLNLEKLDFGIQQNKVRVHNVILPEWCG